MKNIYIVGFMATGKTTVAKLVAKSLGREFIDMDQRIENEQAKSIPQIFADCGEKAFRSLERKLLGELAAKAALVVSCGGGLICNKDNLGLLKTSGITINLKAKSSTIFKRAKKADNRPLLKVDDPLKSIEELLRARAAYYQQADYSVDTDNLTPEEVSAEVLKLVRADNG